MGRASQKFKLESDEERAALKRLGLSKPRERLVVDLLNRIARTVESRYPNRQKGRKPSQVFRDLKRRAEQVKAFVVRLEKPLPLPSLMLPQPPIRELRLYAERLEAYTQEFAGRGKGEGASPPKFGQLSDFVNLSFEQVAEWCRPHSLVNPRPKRRARPETASIRKLIRLVRAETGGQRWNDLAALLKRPCNDVGLNKDRLRSLEKDAKRKTIRNRTFRPYPPTSPKPRTTLIPAG
jgi:hypothetical protein